MKLVKEFGGYNPSKGCNHWGIIPETKESCKFPSDARIPELGKEVLGDLSRGCPRLRGWEIIGNYLLLYILPKTSRKSIDEFVDAIGKETQPA